MKQNGQFDLHGIIGNKAEKDLFEKRKKTKILLLELEKIIPNPGNIFPVDLEETEKLAANIEENGILHDLVCYYDDEIYLLVSGHRRLAAMQKLVADGKRYSYHGMDITGKAPVTIMDNPRDPQLVTLQIITGNHARTMSAEAKKKIIRETLDCLKKLESKGTYEWPKGKRTCTVLSEKTGISEHFIKDYLAETGMRKSNTEDAQHTVPSHEDRKQARAVQALKKSIRSLDRQISAIDKTLLEETGASGEIKEQILQLIAALQEYVK